MAPPAARRPLWVGLAVAVVGTAGVVGLRLVLAWWLGDRVSLLPLLAAVVVAAWAGGLWPGLLATALGAACGFFFLMLPEWADDGQTANRVMRLVLFVGIGGLVSGLCEQLHRGRRRVAAAEQSADRAGEERFRSLADLVPQIVFVTRAADGVAEFLNERWFEYVGAGGGEPAALWSAVHPDDRERARAGWEQARACRRRFTAELRLRRHDGAYRWFLTRTIPVRDAGGRVVKWYGTSTDIHDQKMSEQALRDADRRKDTFLATLAHELKTPLAPIATGLTVLDRGADADTAARVRGMIARQLAHLSALVDDLLDVSRIGRGKLSVRRQAVDLAAVVRQAVEAVTPAAEAAGHTLAVAVPPAPVPVLGDRTRLAQVVTNVLANAVRYTPPGGRIDLTLTRDGPDAVVAVADTGRGIPADVLPRIFGLFDQGRAADTAAGGLGIGLALVKGLAEVHGGSVTAASDGPGRGSTFTVRLPLIRNGEGGMRNDTPGPRPLRVIGVVGGGSADHSALPLPHSAMRRVLVADDNVDAADSLALLLELGGHAVKTAYDGEQAVAAAEEHRPHLILMDVAMPKLDGLDAARRIRRCPWAKACRIVALTGWAGEGDREKSAAAGCDDHWVKPVAPETVTELLATLPDS